MALGQLGDAGDRRRFNGAIILDNIGPFGGRQVNYAGCGFLRGRAAFVLRGQPADVRGSLLEGLSVEAKKQVEGNDRRASWARLPTIASWARGLRFIICSPFWRAKQSANSRLRRRKSRGKCESCWQRQRQQQQVGVSRQRRRRRRQRRRRLRRRRPMGVWAEFKFQGHIRVEMERASAGFSS